MEDQVTVHFLLTGECESIEQDRKLLSSVRIHRSRVLVIFVPEKVAIDPVFFLDLIIYDTILLRLCDTKLGGVLPGAFVTNAVFHVVHDVRSEEIRGLLKQKSIRMIPI